MTVCCGILTSAERPQCIMEGREVPLKHEISTSPCSPREERKASDVSKNSLNVIYRFCLPQCSFMEPVEHLFYGPHVELK